MWIKVEKRVLHVKEVVAPIDQEFNTVIVTTLDEIPEGFNKRMQITEVRGARSELGRWLLGKWVYRVGEHSLLVETLWRDPNYKRELN